MERTDIRYALTEAAEDKDLSNRCNEDQKKYSLLRRTWRLVLSMERIPSKLGHDKDWWNETLTRGMNLKKPFTIVLFAVQSQPEVCCLCLITTVENVSVQFQFWSLGLLSKKCLSKLLMSRNACQVIRLGVGDDFHGPSGQALPLPSRISFLRARFFLRPLLPRACYAG